MSGRGATATAFAASQERFDALVGWLDGVDATGLTHAELEQRLDADGGCCASCCRTTWTFAPNASNGWR